MSVVKPNSVGNHTSELTSVLSQHREQKRSAIEEAVKKITPESIPVSTISDDHWRPVSNAISSELFVTRIKKVSGAIAAILNQTFGPGGGFTVCAPDHAAEDVVVTKDGYHIMREIEFVDDFSSTILRIMRDASRRVAKNAGDGSTSAVIMSNHLLQQVFTHDFTFSKPMLNSGLTAFETVVMQHIDEELAMTVRDSDLVTIAKIATNNNPVLGKYVADLVVEATKTSNDAAIQVGLSKDEDDHVTTQNGFRLYADILDELFYNTTIGNAKAAKSDTRTHILAIKADVTNEILNKIILPIMSEVLTANESFVVVAKSFSKEVERALVSIKTREASAPMWFFTTGVEERNSARFDDMCVYAGCYPITHEVLDNVLPDPSKVDFERFLGQLTGFDMHSNRLIISSTSSPALEALIATLKENIESVNARDAADVYAEANKEFAARLANLEAKAVHLAVGGKSEAERKARHDAIEDAVFACLSARKSGYISGGGGGLGILKFLISESQIVKDEIIKILVDDYAYSQKASYEVASYVLGIFISAYASTLVNVYEKTYVPTGTTAETILQHCLVNNVEFDAIASDYVERGIISPASTDIEILKGTVSIVKSLACSNQFLFTQAHKNI